MNTKIAKPSRYLSDQELDQFQLDSFNESMRIATSVVSALMKLEWFEKQFSSLGEQGETLAYAAIDGAILQNIRNSAVLGFVSDWKENAVAASENGAMQENTAQETVSIPVEVAAEVAENILHRAIAGYKPDFKSKDGYVQWGKVCRAFKDEMIAASRGDVMLWDGELQPAYESKLRQIDAKMRNWPEPARSECIEIIANR